ncbi:MAG: hypothetical protein ACE5MI_12780 [Acidimicrobiia bacterium]
MIIDCDACAMQHTSACEDCVVTFILDEAHDTLELSEREMRAIARLSDAGLVPPLRLLPRTERSREAS